MKAAGKISPLVKARLKARVEQYARENLAGKYTHIEVSVRGSKAYIDLYSEPAGPFGNPAPDETREQYMDRLRKTPQHLCRLDYLGNDDRWRFAFYTNAHEKYEPSFLISGSPIGTPEEAMQASTMWL